MCGRFALTTAPDEVRKIFGYEDRPNFPPRYNIAPTQPLAIVRQDLGGRRRFHLIRWGLVPAWAKDPASFTLLINARAETATKKPSFRSAMRHHRCLIPASGFYEWRRTAEGKQPFWISPADGGVMAFAGLWDTWSDPDGGDIDTGAMLTVQSNRMMSQIHDRMPVILKPYAFDTWLDVANVDRREARTLLQPVEDDFLVATPVSSRVNKVAHDDADLLIPVELEERVQSPGGGARSLARPDAGSQLDLF